MRENIKKDVETKEQKKGDKKEFEQPQLTFIEPKLTKHGDATKITTQNSFFGAFSPGEIE